MGNLFLYLLGGRSIDYDPVCKIALDPSGEVPKLFSYDVLFRKMRIQLPQKGIDIVPDDHTELEGYLAFLEIHRVDQSKLIDGFAELYARVQFPYQGFRQIFTFPYIYPSENSVDLRIGP